MQVDTFQYRPNSGFSPSLPSDLDSPRTLVLVFAAPELGDRPELFTALKAKFPLGTVMGCSTAGEIAGLRLSDHSLSVAVVRFSSTDIRLATAEVGAVGESYDAACLLASQLTSPGLRAVLVLSDGLRVNGSELARGFKGTLPQNVAVTGGLAADGSRFERTWVVANGVVADGIVVAVGLYGDQVQIGHGSRGGWDVFGPERIVTRSTSNVLYELDGKPALELYKRYLGDRVSELPASALLFPLSLRINGDAHGVVRTILGVNEDEQSLTFAGEIPQGAKASLMRANVDRLIHGAAQAATHSRKELDESQPTLAIAISCVGRRLVLGERTEEEIEATLDALPAGSHQVGFYSYGELCPQDGGSCCDLHNQTMTMTTISERR
jgi:hypothetical protein